MKKLMQNLIAAVLIIMGSIACNKIYAQCTPPMSETCEEAKVLCSLDEMNGYSCTNSSTQASPCSPLCSQGGVGNNTSWWAFVTQGGQITITLSIGACNNGQGLEYGVWADCVCGEEVICRSSPCLPPNSITVSGGAVSACKTYYLWVDGCNGDICNFTINTSGGGTPTLSPLGFINNKANMIIEPVCVGACNVLFFVNPQTGGCLPTYVWTLDGNEAGGNSNQIYLDGFNAEGDFVICVTAYIGNPSSGSICSQQGPQCATIKVRRIADKIGLPRVLCYEQTKPGGYKWHSQKITYSGTYREQFNDATCCKYDSVVEFKVLETPVSSSVYYITCDNSPYIDILGKKHPPCLNKSKIVLSKTSDLFKCDSAIELTAINVDFAPTWSSQCINGMIELMPNVNIVKPCNSGESYQFEYKWFKKSDPTHTIGSNDRLLVNSISEDYCLEVKVRTELESEIAFCTKTFCEKFNEGNLAPECAFKIVDGKVYCYDPFGVYRIDSLFSPKVNFYTWKVTGGSIVSKADSSAVQIKWLLNSKDTGKVCVSYNTDCGTSCEKCISVVLQTKIAGPDFEKRGLSAYLDAKPNPNGTWRVISGPHQVSIDDPTNPRSRISAYNYGVYCFEWTINDPNCVIKDTICIDLHSFPTMSPQYPTKLYFERARLISDQDQLTKIIFTPNLIENKGESFVTIDNKLSNKINYRWFDIYGRVILHDEMIIESGNQRINIHSPIQEGMYFLVFELNGVSSVRKVCVIE